MRWWPPLRFMWSSLWFVRTWPLLLMGRPSNIQRRHGRSLPWFIVSRPLISRSILPRPVISRSIVPGPLLPGPVVPGSLVPSVISLPIISRPIFPRSILPSLVPHPLRVVVLVPDDGLLSLFPSIIPPIRLPLPVPLITGTRIGNMMMIFPRPV